MKRKTVAVVGPTASGKTSLGVHIAKKFDGEVISADSMQIYKGMDISTAKPTAEETKGVKHHLTDFLDISETYSVSSFCKDAKTVFDGICQRGKLPVIVGGTGLYIDSFIGNTAFFENASSSMIREELKNELSEKGAEYMYSQLQSVDPESALKIHPNNTVRVLRALEVFKTTGEPISRQVALSHINGSDIEPLFIGITFSDRKKLYDRINTRVDMMMEQGLLAEAEMFFKSSPSKTAFNAIGCKEFKPYFDGEKSLDECVEDLKRDTRHYAKRQLTWFKRNSEINWIYPDTADYEEILADVDNMINGFLGR